MKRTTTGFFAALLLIGSLSAQNIDISKLTPEQVEAYKNYKSSPTAVSSAKTAKTFEPVIERTVDAEAAPSEEPQAEADSVFGASLFSGSNPTFEPNLNIPTPKNYVLGALDELIVDVSGLYEANYKIKVSQDGSIRIPNVGPVQVAGLTIENAARVVRGRLAKIYSGVGDGRTSVNLTLGHIRSIRVLVVGEAARPGSYTLPSLATAFNALYACGGPGPMGSMRNIRVIRSNKTVASVDVYRFLMEGVLSDNLALQDGDVIRIEPYDLKVQVKGEVKHAGIFEAIKGEHLNDLIQYAGGYTEKADKSTITAFRLTEKGKAVLDVAESQQSAFELKSGDEFLVTAISDKFENRVDIEGQVYRPGAYALIPDMTVGQLIAKAEGIKEDAYLKVAFINRKKENGLSEIMGFNLGDLLQAKTADIPLQKNDSLMIGSLFDYREKETVSISGAVLSQGTYPLVDNLSLKDLIFKAKGFLEMAATESVELVRIIKDPKVLSNSIIKTEIFKFALDKDMNFIKGGKDMILQNGDQVIVRYVSGYEGIRMVRIDGEVVQPGNYSISSKSEYISELMKRCGGLTQFAYPMGAFLIRQENSNELEKKLKLFVSENIKRQLDSKTEGNLDANLIKTMNPKSATDLTELRQAQNKLSGSGVIDSIFNKEGIVGINLKEIMSKPGSKWDLYLEEGDVIYVPRELQTIRVFGEVLFPTYVRYDKTKTFEDYISSSGGYSERANRKSAFVLYANGTAKSTSSFLGFRHYPMIKPGASIVIPQKPVEIKNKMSTGEFISVFSSIATVAALIFTIIR